MIVLNKSIIRHLYSLSFDVVFDCRSWRLTMTANFQVGLTHSTTTTLDQRPQTTTGFTNTGAPTRRKIRRLATVSSHVILLIQIPKWKRRGNYNHLISSTIRLSARSEKLRSLNRDGPSVYHACIHAVKASNRMRGGSALSRTQPHCITDARQRRRLLIALHMDGSLGSA